MLLSWKLLANKFTKTSLQIHTSSIYNTFFIAIEILKTIHCFSESNCFLLQVNSSGFTWKGCSLLPKCNVYFWEDFPEEGSSFLPKCSVLYWVSIWQKEKSLLRAANINHLQQISKSSMLQLNMWTGVWQTFNLSGIFDFFGSIAFI